MTTIIFIFILISEFFTQIYQYQHLIVNGRSGFSGDVCLLDFIGFRCPCICKSAAELHGLIVCLIIFIIH